MADVTEYLPQSTFSTEHFPPKHRFDAWRAALATSHDIYADRENFFGRVRTIAAGDVILNVIDSAPIALDRTRERVRRDDLDYFVVHLTSHAFRADADGEAVAFSAGMFSVNDMARPMRRESAPEKGGIAARIPRALLRSVTGDDCDDLHGRLIDAGGTGLLLATHLRDAVATAPTTVASAAPAIAQATASLIAACLKPTTRTIGEALPAIEAAKFLRARALIDARLSSPDLRPQTVAGAAGLSRSALFRAFEPFGGVAAYIWTRRLEAVHRALLDPRDRRTIAAIGSALGFTSSAHLTRAFRRRYGASPRDVREAHRASTSGRR